MDRHSVGQAAPHLPIGTVTFLLTDVQSSTFLWEPVPDARGVAIHRHYQLLDTAISLHHGVRPQEQGEGDSVVAVFECASDAVAAALDIQRAFITECWPEGAALKVRVALHTAQARGFDLAIQLHGNGVLTNPLTGLLGAPRQAGFYRTGDWVPDADLCIVYPEYGSEVSRLLKLVESKQNK